MTIVKHDHTRLIATHDKNWLIGASKYMPISYKIIAIKKWNNTELKIINLLTGEKIPLKDGLYEYF